MEENNNTNLNINQSDNISKIAGAILLSGLLIAGAILLRGGTSGAGKETPLGNTQFEFKKISSDEHVLGNLGGEIKIIEYSDTECPYCKVFQGTLHKIVGENNQVGWIYRHFPIAGLHPKAFHEAEATECAWEEGGNDGFWKYLDEVFKRTPSNNRLEVVELTNVARDLEFDLNVFNSCLASGKYAGKIQADMEDGGKAGARGTPYSLVVSKNKITTERQKAILDVVGRVEYVTFDPGNQYVVSLNGALPIEMVSGIIEILLK